MVVARFVLVLLLGAASSPSAARPQTIHGPDDANQVRAGEGPPVLAPFDHVRFCLENPSECERGADMVAPDHAADRRALKMVNETVNRAIRPIAKRNGETRRLGWSVNPSSGDCNDYAVTKRHVLLGLGYPAGALLLAVVRLSSGEGHLVLLVRTRTADLVLDNLTSDIRPWRSTFYEWIERQSQADPNLWVSIRPQRERGPLVVAALRGSHVD